MSRGITLVELMVVLAIIAIIIGMSVPALMGYSRQLRLKTTTREAMGLVSLARSLAISSHEERAVRVDEERRQIQIINLTTGEPLEHVVRIPPSMTVSVEEGGQPTESMQFIFRPTGSLTGRTVSLRLADQHKQHTIVITAATGAVTLHDEP
ncbi:MAG: GspH/FimT family pseudopilin [Candidatus Omnitrophica bacterium]|nr:GspH/FimT family pseudopilin [Candidatus Omnitrophota bacterium]